MVADNGKPAGRESSSHVSRRSVLATVGGTGFVALAGCTGGGDGGDGGDGGSGTTTSGETTTSGGNTQTTKSSGGSVDKVTIGSTAPLSGPYSVAGETVKKLINLAGQQAIEAGEINDFELMIGDSKSDPATARKVTQQQLDNGADFFVSAYQSSTINALARLLARKDTIFMSTPGWPHYDTEECVPNFFKFTRAMPAWIYNAFGYSVDQGLGTSAYTIHSDVLQMNLQNKYAKEVYAPAHNIDYKGSSAMPFGTTDFSQPLTKAKESGADIVNFFLFGADLVNALSQAKEFGFLENDIVLAVAATSYKLGGALDPDVRSYDKAFFGLVGGYHEIDTPENNKFTKLYRDTYDEWPSSQNWYMAPRTLLRAVSEAGTKDKETVQETLKGHAAVPDLFGTGEKFRACDNRLTIPAVTMQGRKSSEIDKEKLNFFKVVNINDNVDEIMYPCDQIACQNN